MPGILSGAVEGFMAGDAAQHNAAIADIESRREAAQEKQLNFEQQSRQFEIDRQKTSDALTAVTQQQEDLKNQSRSPWLYMQGRPDPNKDPLAYQEWADKPETMAHHKTLLDLDQQAQDLTSKRDQLMAQMGGLHVDQAKRQADRTQAQFATGAPVTDMKPGDLANYLALRSKLPPDMLKVDATGRLPMAAHLDTLDQAMQSGDWSKVQGNELSMAYPQVASTVVNHTIPGVGLVTGVQLLPGSFDKDDPDKINLRQVWQVHDPDSGEVKTVNAPEVVVSREQGAQQLGQLHRIENLAMHPDVQQKMQQAFNEGSTFLHQFQGDLGAAGIPSTALLPAPYQTEKVGQGQRLLFKNPLTGLPLMGADGQPQYVEGAPKPQTKYGMLQEVSDVLNDPNASEEEKEQARQTLQSVSEDANAGRAGGGIGGGRYGGRGGGGTGGVTESTPYGKPADRGEIQDALDDLKTRIAINHNSDVSQYDVKKGENPFQGIKDPKERMAAEREYAQAGGRMRRDLLQGKRDGVAEDYLGPASSAGDIEPGAYLTRGATHQGMTYIGPDGGQGTREQWVPTADAGRYLQTGQGPAAVPAAQPAAPAAPARAAAPMAAQPAPPPMSPEQKEARRVRGYAEPVDPAQYADAHGGGGGLGGRRSSGAQRLDGDIADAKEKVDQLQAQVRNPPKGLHGWQASALPDHLKAQMMRLQELMALKAQRG